MHLTTHTHTHTHTYTHTHTHRVTQILYTLYEMDAHIKTGQ